MHPSEANRVTGSARVAKWRLDSCVRMDRIRCGDRRHHVTGERWIAWPVSARALKISRPVFRSDVI